jgi:hypothetical protein
MSKAQKTVVATAVESTLDNVSIAIAIGKKLGELNSLQNKAELFKGEINNFISTLHSRKAVVGRYKKDGTGCAIATAFIDGCVSADIAPATAQRVYLGTFKDAVATGKAVDDWNKNRADAKAKAKGKGKGKAELSQLLLKAFNHADFEEACQVIEMEYLDDKGTVHALVKSWLEAQGIEFKAE